jgi:carbon-monoxide dehydrogenase small subunit
MTEHRLEFGVNGTPYSVTVPARLTLADMLREELDLTATHLGCEQGACGACTVLVDGQAVRSCLMLAVQADGAEIGTLEGVGTAGSPHPLQETMTEKHGLQCGFCTPGVMMTAVELLDRTPAPSEAEMEQALGGVLCRCTGYVMIKQAVQAAAERMGDR